MIETKGCQSDLVIVVLL